MKKLLVFTIVCLLLASCTPVSDLIKPGKTGPVPNTGGNPATAATASAKTGLPNFEHIILIMLENRDYSSVIGNDQMPLLNTLANQNVLLSNYFAITHPSLPNYIGLMSGSTQGITSDCTGCFVNQPNLADEIEASGRTWKAYLESMPSPCFLGDAGDYAQKHDPLLYFDSIRLNAARCDRSILPLTSLDSDLANNQLPNFSFIMPNLCNSGHSCPASVPDKWVSDMVTKLQASPALGTNSLIIVTFDEGSDKSTQGCCGLTKPAGGKVAVVLISPSALPDITDNTPYSHYSLLKTILTAWDLPLLGQTALASTQAILGPWTGLSGQAASPNPTNVTTPVPSATSTPIPTVFTPVVCAASSPAAAKYTTKVCLSEPTDGSSLSGNAEVTATISTTGDDPGVQRMIFNLGTSYLLTDYSSPYTFILPTTKWADGNYLLTASAMMRDGFTTDTAQIEVNFKNGNASTPVNTSSFSPSSGTVPASGQPFLVAAAGDGASGESTATGVINLVRSLNPNLFLYLGDVYENGSMAEFFNWYGSGSANFAFLRAITDPTIGNHEYNNGVGGTGYFDYWNNIPNYYSFNAGGWHFISLNSNSAYAAVKPGSDQYQWLQQDLAANAQSCTVVYYHHPLFNIGAEGSNEAMSDIWALLAQYGVSIVLNGHDHDYQRWVPLDGSGQPNPNGITEFVAGGGGHGLQKFVTSDNRVAYSNNLNPTAFGVLLLQLGQNGTNFSYHSSNGSILDSGYIPCKQASPGAATPGLP